MNHEFFELCRSQYVQENKDADAIYQRAGIMLVAIPLLCATFVKLGRTDILGKCFTRIDILFYYCFTLIAVFTIITSVVFIFLCIYPRKYKTLANMNVWQKWREDYQTYLGKKESTSIQENDLNEEMINNLCQKLTEAQPINAEINERRRKAFQKSVLMATIALTAIGLQALFYLILKIRGV